MAQINPHVNFNGNAEEAFHFYRSIFGGNFSKIIRFKDIASEAFPVSASEEDKIMHIELPIGHTKLMANDVPAGMGTTNELEHRSKIYVVAENKDEASHIFSGLSEGGKVEIPLTESPDGSFFAMLRDQFGIEWMISFNPSN